jgi:transcriptional antiterminator NusG
MEENKISAAPETVENAVNETPSDAPATEEISAPVAESADAVSADVAPAEAANTEEGAKQEEEYDIGQSDNKSGKGMGWYVVHTYSGYEGKVKANIEKAVENRHLENEILEVRVPMQDVVETKNNQKKTVSKKLFPGYVLIHMDADNNDAWYVVRNTRGVTGFVGPGSKPVPLSEDEMRVLNVGAGERKIHLDVKEGDQVSVTSGVWQDTVGIVKRVDEGKQVVIINVDLFGRETPVEIAFTDVRKIKN